MPYNFKDISTWNTPGLNLGQQMQPVSVGGRMFYPTTAGGQINTTPGYIQTNTTTVNSGAPQQAEGTQQTGGGFSDVMSKGLSVAGGVMNLANTYMDLSSIADTSQQWNDIEDVRNVGRNQYSSFDTLAQDYSLIEDMPQSYDYRDIRGKNDGEMVAGVGNAMLQGASAGAAFGPWGMAIGAAGGLGVGLAGVFTGNKKARHEQRWLQDNAVMVEHSAQDNLNAGQEQLRDYQFRSGVARMADWGGKIERRNESIRQFADRVLHKKPRRISDEATGSFRIERKHCNGGIMIRIKR